MLVTTNISTIQHVLDRWRVLGSLKAEGGIELIGRFPNVDPPTWTHILFPGLAHHELRSLEADLRRPVPRSLRMVLGRIGGMNLFTDAFRMAGRRSTGFRLWPASMAPDGLVDLNHELETAGWLPASALAFARNSWDGSVHVCGMGSDPDQVARCCRTTGAILEKHDDAIACLADKLTNLDRLLVGDTTG